MAVRAMQWTRGPRHLISSVTRRIKIIVSKVSSVALFQISVLHNIDVGAFSEDSTSHEIFFVNPQPQCQYKSVPSSIRSIINQYCDNGTGKKVLCFWRNPHVQER